MPNQSIPTLGLQLEGLHTPTMRVSMYRLGYPTHAPRRPHIFKERGFWRVSPCPKPYFLFQPLWTKAHAFVCQLNYTEEA